jgi:glycogen phosphorylase
VSTAGKEASGTGNMKFAMNGALTIGTLDGANIEIRDEVGADNFFLFGLNTEEVRQTRAAGYAPYSLYHANPHLREVIDLLRSGFFAHGDGELFRPLVDNLLGSDPYLALADFDSYSACQEQVGAAYRDVPRWTRMSILNTARSGKFSSDRTIHEYCHDLWKVEPVSIPMLRAKGELLLP